MANTFERLFAFIESPQERPWVAMGALAIFFLIGASWINQAQVLPGVSVSETGLEGSIVEIIWDDDGMEALALIEDNGQLNLYARTLSNSDGWIWEARDCDCNVTSIGGDGDSWVIGGENGWMGIMSSTGLDISPRSLNWPSTAPDIISLDGDISNGWMIVGDTNSQNVHTWAGLEVSQGAAYPIPEIVLDEVKEVAGGALIIGHDKSSNPALGLSSEVLIDAARNSNNAPQLTLLHRGAGAPFHTIIPMADSPFIAVVGGGDAIYGVTMERNIHRVSNSIEVQTFAIDDHDVIWFVNQNGLHTHDIGDVESTSIVLPNGVSTDLVGASMSGDNLVMFSSDSSNRVTIDVEAQHSVLRSLSLLADLILVMTFVAFAGFGGHALLRKHELV